MWGASSAGGGGGGRGSGVLTLVQGFEIGRKLTQGERVNNERLFFYRVRMSLLQKGRHPGGQAGRQASVAGESWVVASPLSGVHPPPTQAASSSSSHGRTLGLEANERSDGRAAFVLACRHREEPAVPGPPDDAFPLVCAGEYDGSPSGLAREARYGFQRAPHSQSVVWMAKESVERNCNSPASALCSAARARPCTAQHIHLHSRSLHTVSFPSERRSASGFFDKGLRVAR